MLGSDVCYAPVLSLSEAPKHPHNAARKTFVEVGDVMQPAPAPRFSRTVPETKPVVPVDNAGSLSAWGFSKSDIESLQAASAF